MPTLPDYWLPKPSAPFGAAEQAAFDRLLDAALTSGGGELDYTLAAPKWQFLCYAAEQRGLALHGSANPAIAQFEPRQASDLRDFGRQQAIYAAADGIWAMFFAIVDRARYNLVITNAAIRLVDPAGNVNGPFYFFSVSDTALPHNPWRSGTVYLLPRATFMAEAPMPFGDVQVYTAQLASLEPVTPLARLTVTPEDFPFLAQIRGHDDTRLEEYARVLSTGAPWPDA